MQLTLTIINLQIPHKIIMMTLIIWSQLTIGVWLSISSYVVSIALYWFFLHTSSPVLRSQFHIQTYIKPHTTKWTTRAPHALHSITWPRIKKEITYSLAAGHSGGFLARRFVWLVYDALHVCCCTGF